MPSPKDEGPSFFQQYGYIVWPILGVLGGLVLLVGGYAMWRGPHRSFLPDRIRKRLQRNIIDDDDDEDGPKKPKVPIPDRFLGKENAQERRKTRDPNKPTRADAFKAEVMKARESGIWSYAHQEKAQAGPDIPAHGIRLPPPPVPAMGGMAQYNHAGRGVAPQPPVQTSYHGQAQAPGSAPGQRRHSSGQSERMEWMQAPRVASIDETAEMEDDQTRRLSASSDGSVYSIDARGNRLPRRTSSVGALPPQFAHAAHEPQSIPYSARARSNSVSPVHINTNGSNTSMMTSPIMTSPSVAIPPVAARPPRRESISSSPVVGGSGYSPTRSEMVGVGGQASLGYGRPPVMRQPVRAGSAPNEMGGKAQNWV